MPRPHPVLLMVRQLGIGGSERQLAEIARKLDRGLFDPHVGCFHPSGMRAAELKAAGVPVVCFDLNSLASISALAACRRIAAYIREHRIALVHAFDAPTAIYTVPAVKLASRALALSSQRAHRGLTTTMGRWVLRGNDRMMDGIVVNCEYLRRHLMEDERIPGSLIHLCYNGTDVEAFRPEPRRQRPTVLEGASLVIGVVCALRPEKGLGTLVEAFARARKLRAGLKLLIVGSGPCLSELESLARRLGIISDCIFEPATSDVAFWLRSIDIFVLPSLSEALSNSLTEAMACGCCAVASDVGGNPELVTHRQTGLLFRSGDSTGLAEALGLLISDEVLRSNLARAGMLCIRERFTLERSARRMGDIYGDLLENAER